MKKSLLAAVAAALMVVGTAPAQTVSDLLQKAIYAEETAGDLDGAIKLYRQVLAASTETRAFAAQAQYRVGTCLLRKGDQSGARQAFETLIKDYPDQTELVAKARESMPAETRLLPAPWAEGDAHELRLRLPAGAVVGTQVYTVDPGPPGTLVVETRNYIGGAQWVTRVEMDRDTMKPKSSVFANPQLGDFQVTYETARAIITQQDKPPKTLNLEQPVYDNEEGVQLLRRLPLVVGAKFPTRILSPAGGVVIPFSIDVLALEDVTVPAGTFRAFKVQFAPLKQYFWIGQDAPRPLVKFDAVSVVAELVAVRRSGSAEPLRYSDAKFGVSFTAPPNWSVQPVEFPGKPEQNLILLDPEVQGQASVWEGQYPIAAAEIESRLRKEAEEKVPGREKALEQYRVRPESWQTWTVGGRPAISYIADYKDRDKPMVEYLTWVRSEQVSTQFMMRAPAADFAAFRRRMEPTLLSVRIH
jgi:tetratricopeptide (TPR) repeat protein